MYMTNSAKWTSTVSNRLPDSGRLVGQHRALQQHLPGGPRAAALFGQLVQHGDRLQDTASGRGRPDGQLSRPLQPQGSASYVTGSHNVQLGCAGFVRRLQRAGYLRTATYDGVRTTINGVLTPSSVSSIVRPRPGLPICSTRPRHLRPGQLDDEAADPQLRLALGLPVGVGGRPARGPGPSRISRPTGDQHMPIQTNWEPHVSMIYDLFGNGKTAVAPATTGKSTARRLASRQARIRAVI